MSAYGYPIDIQHEGPLFRVIFPDFDATETYGESRETALDAAVDLLETMISARIAEGLELPVPSPAHRRHVVQLSPMTALKAAIHQTMHTHDISHAELARRLGWQEIQVDHLTDPRHPSRLDQLESALTALGRRIVITVAAA
ncbi:MAG: type II toxin-antitoxin system HicB family antitoxin [Magnetococcales bacterium]|nr:type II toxin-antitoxin system HicB family antitoxin [Magnetococcales bacterium]